MRKLIAAILFLFFLLLNKISAFCKPADSMHLAAPGASLIKLHHRFGFTEGPAVDKQGNIYFTDQPNNTIWKYNTRGKLSVFMTNACRANGLYFDPGGRLVACADENNRLLAINIRTHQSEWLLTDFRGQKLNGPNDLWIDKNGGIYFTDPYYQRDYWTRKQPDLPGEYVYYLSKGATQAVIVDSTLQKPNGIVGTPDGTCLFVADISGNKTYRYTINPDGSLHSKQLFIPQGADGITLDSDGNLYLCGKGVTVYNKRGRRIGNIPVPADWVGNLCFGGKERNLLFITASESIYTLQMQVKGVE